MSAFVGGYGGSCLRCLFSLAWNEEEKKWVEGRMWLAEMVKLVEIQVLSVC